MTKLESAFPVNTTNAPNPGAYEAEPGMTLRDWFAGQALSFAAFHATDSENHQMRREFLPEDWAARMSYAFADAMLAERARTQGDAA